MKRIYFTIPNVAFHKVVKQYAFEKGKPIFTIVDLDSALIAYIYFAAQRN